MNTKLSNLLQNRGAIPTVVGLVAFGGGLGIGYILGKRRLTVLLQEVVDYIETAEDDGQMTIFDQEFEDHLSENKAKFLAKFDYNEIAVQGEVENQFEEIPPNVINIFTNADADWDYEAELSTREHEAPYVIHKDEFFADEMGFKQETLTYYSGDDIMADPQDTPIYNYGGLMGELKFGHGSKDPNVVYIRNEVIHMEWEVLLHQSSFEHEVLGLSMEKDAEHDLKHSVQKFRRE